MHMLKTTLAINILIISYITQIKKVNKTQKFSLVNYVDIFSD